MKSNKEILILILEEFKNYRRSTGLCYMISRLWGRNILTDEEEISFYNWFQKQKPRKRVRYQFTKSASFTGTDWWWHKDEAGNKERIKFVEYLIAKES